MGSRRLIGKAQVIKGPIEKFSGGVPREHPARAVGSEPAGGQAQEKDFRARIAEPGDRLAPVVGKSFLDIPDIFDEPRAFAAGDDFFIMFFERAFEAGI